MKNAPSAAQRDRGEPEHERALVRHGREVDREDQRPDEHDGEDPAEVVDRVASSR